MGFLAGKRILLTGLLSNRSIAYGIARPASAKARNWRSPMSASGSRTASPNLPPNSAATWSSRAMSPKMRRSMRCSRSLKEHWDALDGLVHSIGFAPREAIAGDFLDGMTRENFRIAHDISAYSFPALAKAALPMLSAMRRCSR